MLLANQISYNDSSSYISLLNILYPIGSIFITISETSPADHLGGTWVEMKDGTLLCKGSGTDYSQSVGSMSGSSKISVNQMPSHNHAGTKTCGYLQEDSNGKISNNNGTLGDTLIYMNVNNATRGRNLSEFVAYTGGGQFIFHMDMLSMSGKEQPNPRGGGLC